MVRCFSPAASLTEQAQNLQVEPDESNHHAEGAVPLHVTGSAHSRAGFNHVKIKNEVKRSDHHHKQTDTYSEWRACIEKGHRPVEEKTHDHVGEINQRDASRRRDNAEFESARSAHDAEFIGQQEHK